MNAVVPDLIHAVTTNLPYGGRYGLASGFKIGPSPPLAGLQVIALCPLIPGVDENDAIAPLAVLRLAQHSRQPFLVQLWRRSVEDGGSASAPGCIIPGGHHAGEARVSGDLLFEHSLHYRCVIIDIACAATSGRPKMAPIGLKLN